MTTSSLRRAATFVAWPLLLAAAQAASGQVVALNDTQPSPARSEMNERFARLDADNNGWLSRQELPVVDMRNDEWSRYDSNRDGKVSFAEYRAVQEGIGPVGR